MKKNKELLLNYKTYLLRCLFEPIEEKIDNPPISFENYLKKFDIGYKMCYDEKKHKENNNEFQ